MLLIIKKAITGQPIGWLESSQIVSVGRTAGLIGRNWLNLIREIEGC